MDLPVAPRPASAVRPWHIRGGHLREPVRRRRHGPGGTGAGVRLVWKSTITWMYYSPIDASLALLDVCHGETCAINVQIVMYWLYIICHSVFSIIGESISLFLFLKTNLHRWCMRRVHPLWCKRSIMNSRQMQEQDRSCSRLVQFHVMFRCRSLH
jgi:hypothetical protein